MKQNWDAFLAVWMVLDHPLWYCPARRTTATTAAAFAGDNHSANHHSAISNQLRRLQRRPATGMFLSSSKKSDAPTVTTTTAVCVLQSDDFPQVASNLAHRLSLPLLSPDDICQNNNDDSTNQFASVISVNPYIAGEVNDYSIGISLVDPPSTPRKNNKKLRRTLVSSMKPHFVDFLPPVSSRLGQRTTAAGQPTSDLLLQAVKGYSNAVVADWTAGWGQDAWLLARAGAARVHMIEQDPVVAALLEDALRRLQVLAECAESGPPTSSLSGTTTATRLWNCLSLECGDAVDIAQRTTATTNDVGVVPDIVYLDPMFPARKKSASVKKSMQVLHSLLGSQEVDEAVLREDQAALLWNAHSIARTRVVVKRPIHAPLLVPAKELQPSYSVTGSINRWDVYVKR